GSAAGSAAGSGSGSGAATRHGPPSPAVWVLRDGAPVRVPVETGLSDGNETAITGGELHEGDLVITGDSSQSSTGGAAGAAGGARGGGRRPPSLF
ncbi:MAG TPA: hypothetical protein VHE35_25125, partial [Kofleriaceae bacterium]|nr:hypothetical protein [Kofleriaceae bacterium]